MEKLHGLPILDTNIVVQHRINIVDLKRCQGQRPCLQNWALGGASTDLNGDLGDDSTATNKHFRAPQATSSTASLCLLPLPSVGVASRCLPVVLLGYPSAAPAATTRS